MQFPPRNEELVAPLPQPLDFCQQTPVTSVEQRTGESNVPFTHVILNLKEPGCVNKLLGLQRCYLSFFK